MRWILALSFLLIVSVNAEVLTFQQGVENYSGTRMTHILGHPASASDTNYSTSPTWYLENDAASNQTISRGLLKFDNLFGNAVGQIKVGSVINSAVLTIRTSTDSWSAGSTDYVYQVLSAWDRNSVTWNNFGSSPGGLAGTDYSSQALVSFHPGYINIAYNLNITSAVQAWSDGIANNGLFFLSSGADASAFDNENNSTVAYRPKLTINFTAPIPEPSSLLILALASIFLFGKSRIR